MLCQYRIALSMQSKGHSLKESNEALRKKSLCKQLGTYNMTIANLIKYVQNKTIRLYKNLRLINILATLLLMTDDDDENSYQH